MGEKKSIPLCVDLDGTLVKLDTLHQAIFLLLRRDPISLFRIPIWLTKGKAHLKDQVLQRVTLDASALPYNKQFLEYLRKEHEAGRKLILATASNYRTADAIADHLGIFSEVLSSSANTNLRHNQKLNAIQERFSQFGYAGNDTADFPIWDAAEEIILVNPTLAARTKYTNKSHQIFTEKRPVSLMLLKAMRCQQWLKNLLIFSPALLAHRYFEPGIILNSIFAFFSFSFAASAIYVLNDLFDLSADQHHPRKSKRPFAAGDLPITTGSLLILLLALLSLIPTLWLPTSFIFALLSYYVITTIYSWRLKQRPIADVLTLAVLYTMRVVAGSAATQIVASGWFIEFSIFLFLSLALVKRLAELHELQTDTQCDQLYRERGYKVTDLPLLLAFGTASGYISVFVFTLYLGSEKVAQLYERPALLWVFCPLLLYWITRIWYLAWQGKMKDDPLAFAAKDMQTYIVGALGIAALILAI